MRTRQKLRDSEAALAITKGLLDSIVEERNHLRLALDEAVGHLNSLTSLASTERVAAQSHLDVISDFIADISDLTFRGRINAQ